MSIVAATLLFGLRAGVSVAQPTPSTDSAEVEPRESSAESDGDRPIEAPPSSPGPEQDSIAPAPGAAASGAAASSDAGTRAPSPPDGATTEIGGTSTTQGNSASAVKTGAAPVGASSTQDGKAKTGQVSKNSTLAVVMRSARKARCATAICFGEDYEWAIEPLVELPIGNTFAVGGLYQGGLSDHINSHDYKASLAAGLRFWALWDYVSLSVYFSTPIAEDETVRIAGTAHEYNASSIRRPYPGLALGALADSLWLGFNIEELVNGDTDQSRDPRFPRNAVVDRVMTMTVAFAPVALIRSGLGLRENEEE